MSWPWTRVREWQAPMMSSIVLEAPLPLFRDAMASESKRGYKAPSSSETTMPWVSSPSSVRVPVLSKHMRLTLPAIVTLYGEMQKILLLLRLLTANSTPMLMQVGRAGGTTIVITSHDLFMISIVSTPNITIS